MTLYSLYKPNQKTNNIIYNSPHSGERFPNEFLAHTPIDKYTLLSSGDSFVDHLYENAVDHGSILLANDYARSFMDTNRAAYELDRSMFSGDIPEQLLNHSHKVDLGYGSIAKYAYTRKDIYVTKIPFAEAEARIKEYYFPVHEALTALLSKDHDEYGYTVLIDCHSMPSYEFLNFKSAMSPQPDIVIGNLYGNSCAGELTDYIKNYFESADLTVALNDPFAGGYNTDHYKDPARNKHTVQIELKKSLYMDEVNRCKNGNFLKIKNILNTFTQNLNCDIQQILNI